MEEHDVFVLFGGSGSEIVLCQQLKRNFISCEIHPQYYQMILDRLAHNGKIKDEYRLDFIQERKNNGTESSVPRLLEDTSDYVPKMNP